MNCSEGQFRASKLFTQNYLLSYLLSLPFSSQLSFIGVGVSDRSWAVFFSFHMFFYV